MRDSQRGKVYDSERWLHAAHPEMSWDEVEAYVAKVLGSAYVQRKYPTAKMRIRFVKGRGGGMAMNNWFDRDNWQHHYGPVVSLGVWGRRRSVILHELAHHFAGLSHQHDWRFCEVYLDLVRHFLGQAAHDRLKAEFKARRVRFRKPVKRTMTPEQREAAAARLAAARAAKDAAKAVAA